MEHLELVTAKAVKFRLFRRSWIYVTEAMYRRLPYKAIKRLRRIGVFFCDRNVILLRNTHQNRKMVKGHHAQRKLNAL